jgi:hypothetical protein
MRIYRAEHALASNAAGNALANNEFEKSEASSNAESEFSALPPKF